MGGLFFAREWCLRLGCSFINMAGGETFACVSSSNTFFVGIMYFVVFDQWVFVKVQIYALVCLTKMITIIVSLCVESSHLIRLSYS